MLIVAPEYILSNTEKIKRAQREQTENRMSGREREVFVKSQDSCVDEARSNY